MGFLQEKVGERKRRGAGLLAENHHSLYRESNRGVVNITFACTLNIGLKRKTAMGRKSGANHNSQESGVKLTVRH